jgi:calmodulin
VEEARAAFAAFDRDGDGFIDAAELRAVLGFGAAGAAERQRMIDAYDEDRDGKIDFSEFVKLMETSS